MLINKHIILIGFKHVGKSTLGRALARRLQMKFVDLDDELQKNYAKQYHEHLSCHEIFQQRGEDFFRNFEKEILRKVLLSLKQSVIALGGGAVMHAENQQLIHPHLVIHVTANKDMVYARIMAKGKPAIFPIHQDPLNSLNDLWEQRENIYQQLANVTVTNDGEISSVIDNVVVKLNKLKI